MHRDYGVRLSFKQHNKCSQKQVISYVLCNFYCVYFYFLRPNVIEETNNVLGSWVQEVGRYAGFIL